MLALLVAALLSGPLPANVTPDCSRFCLGVCTWNPDKLYCDDTMVQRLGTWDPRPNVDEWPGDPLTSANEPWGAYPLEKPGSAPLVQYEPEKPAYEHTPEPRYSRSKYGFGIDDDY